MELEKKEQQLTETERIQIDSNIKEDLVEHLYRSVPAGVTNVFLASTGVFIFFYQKVEPVFLFSWLGSFYFALSSIAITYLFYKKNSARLSLKQWQYLLSGLLCFCAVLWGTCLFFNPEDSIHRFGLLGILFMVSAALSMATVGFWKLGIICVSLILMPLAFWLWIQPDFYYKFGGVLVALYALFLMGMNYRSTSWLKDSLRLKIENSLFTYQANHDLFSGLPNQRLLSRYLEDWIQEKNEFVMVCVSINRLEAFINSLGYQISDTILQSTAKRLSNFLGEMNHAQKGKAHYLITHPRTDAFILLITPYRAEMLENTLEQLFKVFKTPFQIGNTAMEVTASVGVSIYPKDGDNGASVLSNTYTAMLQAKQQGGNQVKYYKRSMNEKTPYLLQLENDLHHAMERQELMVYYQPIVDLSTGFISGMEALIRWQHPVYGIVSPADFVFLAEENGSIVPIGDWVLKQACYQAAQWNKQGNNGRPLKVSVNLAPKQLKSKTLVQDIEKILKETNLNPKCLTLELTETAILDETIAPIVHEMSKKGISVSIDDFGTGYSGLSYLRFLKIHTIKIDKSFIQDLEKDNGSATIVSAILGMAKELEIFAVAEGIENTDQLEFLLKQGCQYGQGYYFSAPLSAIEFTRLIKNQKRYDHLIVKSQEI